jgi:hypothetical protein
VIPAVDALEVRLRRGDRPSMPVGLQLADYLDLASLRWTMRQGDPGWDLLGGLGWDGWRDFFSPERALAMPPATMAAAWEIARVPAHRDGLAPGGEFGFFAERFKGHLRAGGVSSRPAHALTGALFEMAANAWEHADAPVPPLAGYEVGGDAWCFVVTDVGCGVAASLRRNPAHRFTNDAEALALALTEGVSGTTEPGRGSGFSQVFKALVDRQCRIRFRTGTCSALWEGKSPTSQAIRSRPLPHRAGFHLEISGRLRESA